MSNIKKLVLGIVASFFALFVFVKPAFAYFPNWNVAGSWVFDYHYGTSVNLHDMTLAQDGAGVLTGSGGAFSGTSPYLYPWTITSGFVDGDNISFTAGYTATVTCSFTVVGTIASNGTMSGTWTDDCDGNRNGTWATTSGLATAIPATYSYKFITTDNGMNGLWATDYFDSKVTITPIGGGCYDVKRVDGGTFQVIDGSFSPGGNGITKVGDGTKGDVSGGIELTICGTRIASPDLTTEDLRSGTWSTYANKYFHRFFSSISSEVQGNWGWTFSTCFNGTWTDNDATETAFGSNPNAMGDIKGTYVPCAKDQCKNDGWKSFRIFKNQGQCVSLVSPNAPVHTTYGNASFSTQWGNVNLIFSVFPTNPVMGYLYWARSAPGANSWYGPVINPTIVGNEATFTVKVVTGLIAGCNVTFDVFDNGDPGIGLDTANITAVTSTSGNSCAYTGQIQNLNNVVSGDIVVK